VCCVGHCEQALGLDTVNKPTACRARVDQLLSDACECSLPSLELQELSEDVCHMCDSSWSDDPSLHDSAEAILTTKGLVFESLGFCLTVFATQSIQLQCQMILSSYDMTSCTKCVPIIRLSWPIDA